LFALPKQGISESRRIYLIAVRVAELLGNDQLVAQTWYHLGNLHSSYDLDKAIEYYSNSYNKFRKIGYWSDLIYICADLASLYNRKEELAKAKAYADEAIKYRTSIQIDTPSTKRWPSDYGLAWALVTKAYITLQEGETINAIQYGKQAISIYQDLERQKVYVSYHITAALSIVGHCYRRIAEYSEAQRYYNQVLKTAGRNGQQTMVASALNDLGTIFSNQGEYEDALSYFEQARSLHEKAASLLDAANAHYNEGIVYQRLEQFPKAISSFSRCIEISTKIGSPGLTMVAEEGIGAVMRAEGRYEESLKALNMSEEIAIAIKDRERLAETHWLKARTYLAMKRFEEANLHIQKAAEIADSAQSMKLLYAIKTTQGEIHIAEGRREQAIKVLTEAVEGLESVREKIIGGEYPRFQFWEQNSSPYHLLCNLMIEKNRGLDALFYAERVKSRVLYDAITERDARMMLRLTDDELSEEVSLSREIDRITEEKKAASSQSNVPQKDLEAKLDQAWLKYFLFKNRIISTRSAGGKYTARPSIDRLKNLRQLSNYKDTLFLEYAVSADRVMLFAITINPVSYAPSVKIFRLPINSKALSSKVESFRRHLADRNPLFADASRDLYNLLIKRAESHLIGKKKICIIPDGFLWDLPFQALQNARRRYLIEEKPIFFAPSLSVLIEMSGQPSRLGKEFSLLALANPTIPKSVPSKLSPLPEAETEVEELNSLNLGPSKIAIGDSATESLLKTESKHFSALHLATHGVLNNNNPLRSHLVLAADKDNEDGILEASEIMRLNLNADLVALSACETARGRIGAGEGVVGISWAFFLAGCRSTLVSQWKVNSDSTARLMAKFYQKIGKTTSRIKPDKSQALRRASLEILKDPRYGHPFYWAGFVLVGNDN
jgi:CHAT domain-containing protein